MVNLNELAKEITLQEGLKESVSIAQVKEILRIVLHEFAEMDSKELLSTVARYSLKKKKGK